MGSILSSLVSRDGIRTSSVESVVLRVNDWEDPAEVSNFLACYRFPKLRKLQLTNLMISSWDLITSNTSVLTALTLDNSFPPPMITLPQILSILRSNPSLQEVTLAGSSIPDDDDGSSFRVPLAHLRTLKLFGRTQGVFMLLHHLDYPRNMNDLFLHLSDVTVDHISGIIGPYLRDYLQRRRSPESGLGLELSHCRGYPRFTVGDPGRGDVPSSATEWAPDWITIVIGGLENHFLLDLATYVPREEITHLRVHNVSISTAVLSAKFPYVREIHFLDAPLHVRFSNLGQDKIFPHLQCLCITFHEDDKHHNDDRFLKTFLDHLESFGNRLDRLELCECDHIRLREKEEIRGMVRELIF
jgi:hypothetical protein